MLKQAPPKAYLRATVSLRAAPVEHFFDIEVDPIRDICYLHGIVERRDGNTDAERFVYFFAPEVTPDAERDAFAQAYAFLTQQSDAAIYYYSKYERTQYRKLQAKYPDVCSAEDIERFSIRRAPSIFTAMWSLRLPNGRRCDHSIKTLAKHLGFAWRDIHPSGAASIEWFDRWCREHDPAVKKKILDYNEDDCRATRVLLDGIRALTVQ